MLRPAALQSLPESPAIALAVTLALPTMPTAARTRLDATEQRRDLVRIGNLAERRHRRAASMYKQHATGELQKKQLLPARHGVAGKNLDHAGGPTAGRKRPARSPDHGPQSKEQSEHDRQRAEDSRDLVGPRIQCREASLGRPVRRPSAQEAVGLPQGRGLG